VSETGHEVIVDHARRLHVRVANRGADKFESALQQILAQRIGNRRPRRDLLHRPPVIDFRAAIDESPDVTIETAEFFLHLEKGLRVLDGGVDFQPVPDDTGVAEQLRDFGRVVTRDFWSIKPVEGRPVVFTLFQDRVPAQPSLRAFQNQKLEQLLVIAHWHAPFRVVITDV